jgi:ferredoxin
VATVGAATLGEVLDQVRDAVSVVVPREGVAELLAALGRGGRSVLGPTERDGAIVIDELDGLDDLPIGRGDDQAPGRYRVTDRGDGALFGFTVGPQSFRQHLFPPRTLLVRTRRTGAGFEVEQGDPVAPPTVLFGVRPCELRAIEVQDRVFGGEHADPTYRARREAATVVVAQCTEVADTCFCTSMGGNPRAEGGFDLAVTELAPGGDLLVEIGAEGGRRLLADVAHRPATDDEVAAARRRTDEAADRITRRVDADALPELLAATLEHPRWDDVAERCLHCASCTMVCPTCFCSAVEDTTDLTGDHAERWRRWDSCFTLGHSELHGGATRTTPVSRYRQWLTHKFGTWHDQFGESGCVGCGRCITWCPVGIDVTEELAALAVAPPGQGAGQGAGEAAS